MPTPASAATAESVTSPFEDVNNFKRRSQKPFAIATGIGTRDPTISAIWPRHASCKTEDPPYMH